MKLFSIALLFIVGLQNQIPAQKIRILVVEARNGKPVPHECLNVSLGGWHGADLIAATDENGVATLKLDADDMIAESVPGVRCQRDWPTAKSLGGTAPKAISLVPDWYVSCQYSKQLVKDPRWRNADPSIRIPGFSIDEIVRRGAVATNACSKLVPQNRPGVVVLIVRKRTFWEGMRS